MGYQLEELANVIYVQEYFIFKPQPTGSLYGVSAQYISQ